MNSAPNTLAATRFIGERVPRKEDARLLTGRGTFVDDVIVPGMFHVAFVRSPIARGRIVAIDRDAARALPGVRAVFVAADIARFPVQMLNFFYAPAEITIMPLAVDTVGYAGEPVVLVIAETRAIAEDAAGLVEVDYDEDDPVITLAQAREAGPIHPGTESNVAAAMGEDELGQDMAALLASATHEIGVTISHQRIAQSPMETRGVVAVPQGADEMIVHITCASPHYVARNLALSFDLPETSFRVIARDVGGSFGLKNQPWKEEMAVIASALILRQPLKWIEDRWENLACANQAREQDITLRAGFDGQGRLLASRADYDCNNGAFPQLADCNIAVAMFLWAAYRMPTFEFRNTGWYTNTAGLAAYRGPWAIETLAREVLLDRAARAIGLDPIEIRRRNLITAADQPTVSAMGIPLEDITPRECLEMLVDRIDIPSFRAEQQAARQQGRYIGLGMAAYIEPTGAAGSIGVMTGELAQLRIEPTGKVVATMSTHSQGHGTQTTMAQVIAETLGVAYEDVIVHEGDSARGGFGPGAAGSRQGVIGGGAAIRAAGLLKDKVKLVAAHLLNASPETVTIENGMVHVAGAPEMTRSLRQIAEIAYGEPDRLPPGIETGLEAQYRYNPPPMTFTSAAHACIVEVSAETGFVTIQRWIASDDCGVMINPAVVEGQIAGGLAQAIGMVLLEEAGYDARGNPQAVTFKDYLLPQISDVPDFEYIHAGTPSKSVGGFRGVGEGGAIIGPPTLVNAIADALAPFGEIPLSLPLSPAKLLGVIEGRAIADHAAVEMHRPTAAAPSETIPVVTVAELEPETTAIARIDGTWNTVLATPMGPERIVMTFATDGETLTGGMFSDQGAQAFTGSVSGTNLKWDLKVKKPMPITLKYDVTIDGDTLRGKVKMGMFGTAKLTGERAENG